MRRLLGCLLFAPALLGIDRIVIPGAAGPNLLEPDVALLSQATSDLRDLRFLDSQGREVGYLLIESPRVEAQWLDGRILPVASTRYTSGLEVDLGRPVDIDRLRLDGIAAPFLKRARIEGSAIGRTGRCLPKRLSSTFPRSACE